VERDRFSEEPLFDEFWPSGETARALVWTHVARSPRDDGSAKKPPSARTGSMMGRRPA
jgi:hypothetical protein